jgi:hypothetical protein
MTRLQLLVEVLQRTHRMLSAADQSQVNTDGTSKGKVLIDLEMNIHILI